MSEEIKEKLDLFPNNMNDIAKEAYYQLENYITNLQQKVEQLEKENKILKENAEHNDKVVDKVNWENMLLKRKNKEIDRLNNIIYKLEKYLEEESKYDEYVDVFYREHMGYVLDKLKKLKEDNK